MFYISAPLPVLLTDIKPVMRRLTGQLAGELVAEARQGWPVATGASREGFRVDYVGESIRVDNVQSYWKYVRRSGTSERAVEDLRRGLSVLAARRTPELSAQFRAAIIGGK